MASRNLLIPAEEIPCCSGVLLGKIIEEYFVSCLPKTEQ
jgi:hypothetical protein